MSLLTARLLDKITFDGPFQANVMSESVDLVCCDQDYVPQTPNVVKSSAGDLQSLIEKAT